MLENRKLSFAIAGALICASPGTTQAMSSAPAPKQLDVGSMPLVRTIDERYMSFQIGMSHLTGGETWSTYDESKGEGEAEQAEDFEAIREVRLPTDLTNSRYPDGGAGPALHSLRGYHYQFRIFPEQR